MHSPQQVNTTTLPTVADHCRAILTSHTGVNGKTSPCIAYSAFTSHNTLFNCCTGIGDFKTSQHANLDTTFGSNSMSKTISAIAVLQLVQQDKLQLDQPVVVYLPTSLFPYGNAITVRHLLTFTSGLPEPLPTKWLHYPSEHDTFDHMSALKRIVADNPKVSRPPGQKHVYGNLGFWFLGELVCTVSGMSSFESYVQQNIFEPLNIPKTDLHFNLIPTITSHTRAKGYIHRWSPLRLVKWYLTDKSLYGNWEGDGSWLEVLPHHINGWAYSGISGTIQGWQMVLQDILQPTGQSVLLNETSKQLMFSQQKLATGELLRETLGWCIGKHKEGKQRYYYRQGGGLGFHSEMRIYPDVGVGSVLMSNATSLSGSARLLTSLDDKFVR